MFLDLPGPVGVLEAILAVPESPGFAAVVCHPHPLYGGTMHNHATFRIARALQSVGGVSLRFQFRGVGRSGGRHHGEAEVDDVLAALSALEERHPTLPRWVAGFSFGARMALRAAERASTVVRAMVAGLALRENDHAFMSGLAIPIAVVQAERDELGSADEVRSFVAGGSGPRRVAVVGGASHLFTENLDGLEHEVTTSAAWLLAQP